MALYTNYSAACPVIPPPNVCNYNVNGATLNLTGLIGNVLTSKDSNNPKYIYSYSPCMNGLVCNEADIAAMIIREMNETLTCNPVLAYYNANIIPSYNINEKYFEFIYETNNACNGATMLTIVKWFCDKNIKSGNITYAASMDECIYEIQIKSILACQP